MANIIKNIDKIVTGGASPVEVDLRNLQTTENLLRAVQTSPQEGDMLSYQNGEWINVPKSKAGVSKARLFFNSAIN